MSKNKEIKKAQKEYEYLTGEESERRIAFLREKAIRDETSIYDAGYHKGIEQGKREIVKSMLQKNMKLEEIMEITKLSKKEIQQIAKKL